MAVSDYTKLFTKYGNAYNLPPELLAAVCWKESRGNPSSEGDTDTDSFAKGLMQMRDEASDDAYSKGGKFCRGGWTRPDFKTLYFNTEAFIQPEVNIEAGASYLAVCLFHYIGSDGNYDYNQDYTKGMSDAQVLLAYVAYNAGGGSSIVRRYLKTGNAENLDKAKEVLSQYKSYMSSGFIQANPGLSNYNVTPGTQTTLNETGNKFSGAKSGSLAVGNTSGMADTYTASTADGIINFATFVESVAFQQTFERTLRSGMLSTLHGVLSEFMSKFYHNFYYIPTLKNNMCILVKPECLFITPPTCNVIYPNMKSHIGYNRSHKSEPTRILSVSDPFSGLWGTPTSAITQLVTMCYIEDKPAQEGIRGRLRLDDYVEVKSITELMSDPNKQKLAMQQMSRFESRNGIRVFRDERGDSLYLYLISGDQVYTKADKDPDSNSSGKKTRSAVGINKKDKNAVSATLARLAKYALLRKRYEMRPGNATMYFNPYILPGFPMLSLEGAGYDFMNLYAYVTDVTHSITDRSWTTSVSFSYTSTSAEPRPSAYPIIEQEYFSNPTNASSPGIAQTYRNMLGDNVKTIGDTETDLAYHEYDTTCANLSDTYKLIWRPLTTREQHLKETCNNPTIVETTYGMKFVSQENNEEDNPRKSLVGNKVYDPAQDPEFFRHDIQDLLEGYVSKIKSGEAFYTFDVR